LQAVHGNGTPTIETLRPGDIPQRDELRRLAFGMPDPDPADRPRPSEDQSVAVYAGDRLVANVTTLSDAHWFGGSAVTSGGVTSVVVAPDQRKRNLARAVVNEAIRRMHARGDAVSVLYPTTATLYRGMGYEMAGWWRLTDIPIGNLASIASAPDVTVEPADAADVEAAYDATAPGHDGWLRRSEAARALLRFDYEHTKAPKARYIARRDGVSIGAFVYSEVREGPTRTFDLAASQLFATDAGALRSLLALGAAHGTMADSVRTLLPPDVLALAVPHGQRLRPHSHFPWMLRIIDVASAVSQRGYPPQLDLEVHLDISGDDLIAANNGRFTLRVRDGKGELLPGGRGDVVVDIRHFAALYTGLAAGPSPLRFAFHGGPPTLVDFF
jgi:predicted acetyltransferase